MDTAKRKRLEAAGWKVGSADEFLGLSPEESALVDTRLRLARFVRERRAQGGLTQMALAKHLGSSQSRVAKIEAGDPSVSIDLMLRAAFATGADVNDVGAALRARAAGQNAGKSKRE